MILSAIIGFVLSAVSAFLALFPSDSVTSFGSSATFAHWSNWIGLFVPINTILAALGVLLVWTAFVSTARLFIWILTLVHVAGGEG